MYKVIIGLDQFKHAFRNGFIDNATVFLYTDEIKNKPSKLVLKAIDRGFNCSEVMALINFLSTKRHHCIRYLNIYQGGENNYKCYTRETFIYEQIKAGRDPKVADQCFTVIECIRDR